MISSQPFWKLLIFPSNMYTLGKVLSNNFKVKMVIQIELSLLRVAMLQMNLETLRVMSPTAEFPKTKEISTIQN